MHLRRNLYHEHHYGADYGPGCRTLIPKLAYNLDHLQDQYRNEPHPEPEGPKVAMDIIEYIKIVYPAKTTFSPLLGLHNKSDEKAKKTKK